MILKHSILLSLIITLVFESRSSINSHYKLSTFELNGKRKNNLIQFRKPDYGDGHRDGCIVSPQISLKLKIKADSLIGRAINSETSEGVPNVNILLVYKNFDSLKIESNRFGHFRTNKSGNLKSIYIQHREFRSLDIEL